MPAVPRIRRAVVDQNEVYRPQEPIPVVANLRWNEGRGWAAPRPNLAVVTAWSHASRAVQIEWSFDDVTRRDWIDADDVQRVKQAAR